MSALKRKSNLITVQSLIASKKLELELLQEQENRLLNPSTTSNRQN